MRTAAPKKNLAPPKPAASQYVRGGSSKPISVLLADDQVMIREGLRALLNHETDILVMGEASNGREAVSMARFLLPDVVVMDIAMPLLNGLEAVRQIHNSHPDIKLLMLSAYSEEVYVDQAVTLGAAGYLIKETASCVLSEAIRKVFHGHSFFSPDLVRRKKQPRLKSMAGRRSRSPQAAARLSSRENEVLQLIAEGKMNKETAEELGISIKTVENHRQSLMNKLGLHDTARLTRHAISSGIIESRAPIPID